MSRHIGIGKETVYGTPVAPTEFVEAISDGLGMDKTFENVAPVRQYAPVIANELTSLIRGDIEVIGEFNGQGLLFKALFGDVYTSGAGPYTHTFPHPNGITDKLKLTIEANRDSQTRTWRYAGSKIVGLNFTASTSQSPRLTWSVVAKSEATGTVATASFPVFTPMVIGDTSIAFDGGAALPVRDVSLTISFPVDEPFKIGSSSFAFEPIDGNIEVTGTCSMYMTDTEMTQYAKYDGSTDVSVALAVDNGTESLTFNSITSRINNFRVPMEQRDRLIGECSWTGIYSTTATGTHTSGTPSATVMTDSAASFTPDALIGWTIRNITDGSAGVITDNDATTITVAALDGGVGDNFEQNDVYDVVAEAVQAVLVNQDAAIP